VRPIQISIRGLRSYRKECTINFENRSLVAIVGDTGAGKSSILEAITYALYNTCTWRGDSKALIADGTHTMLVVLDFEGAGHRWRITRSTSRTASPRAVHKLECLSDGSFVALDRESQVNAKIENIVGLDRRTFLIAVLLPQGNFQTLLTEEAPGERAKILKGIFRVTELEEAKTIADGLRHRAEPALAFLSGHRKALPRDPVADAKQLGSELKLAEARHKGLLAAKKVVDEAHQREKDAKREAAQFLDPVTKLRAQPLKIAATMAALAPVAEELECKIKEAQASLKVLDRDESQASAAHEKAVKGGKGVEALTHAAATLSAVTRDLARIERANVEFGRRREELAAQLEKASKARKGLAELVAGAQRAGKERDTAILEVEIQGKLNRQAQDLLRESRQAVKESRAVATKIQNAEATADKCRQASEKEASALKTANESANKARQALDHASLEHAAAYAAAGLKPGDKCPVCSTILPKGFAPAKHAGLESWKAQLGVAEGKLAVAREAAARASAAHVSALAELTQVKAQLPDTTRSERTAVSALHRILPGADLAQPDATLIAPLGVKLKALEATAKETARAETEAAVKLAREQSRLDAADGALATNGETLKADEGENAEGLRIARDELTRLPAFARPVPNASAEQLAPTSTVLDAHLAQARKDESALQALRASQQRARSNLVILETRYEKQVADPKRRAYTTMIAILGQLNSARALIEQKPFTGPDEAATIAAAGTYAERFESAIQKVSTALESKAESVRKAADEKLADSARALKKLELTTEAELVEAVNRASREIGSLADQTAKAEAAIAVVAQLDEVIMEGTELTESMVELARMLGDGGFVRHVIELRQKNLLAVASTILQDMTARRYGFAADFQVLDIVTGQPRSPRTLSGGETFMASLALALALVEIAGRAGGRLDALFLDEGFGSLDANALDAALGTLEARASDGRLVALVSHIKAVAERIPDVLEVRRKPTGSEAIWRGRLERDQMVAEDLEAGLLV
jgi:DNA repair protein SbcC/Rad50